MTIMQNPDKNNNISYNNILEIGERKEMKSKGEISILGDPGVTANLYCNFAYP